MIAFVTGATGALGVPTVRRLLDSGHRVHALVTNPVAADRVRAAGAEPVAGSLFDPAALTRAVRGADTILHLATRIAPMQRARRRASWRENDRIRRDGTRNLVDAALAADVPTLVYPSFALIYADGGARWLSFDDPIAPTDILTSTVAAESEVGRFTAAGGRGVVLRMAGVYGTHSNATKDLLALARRGVSGFVGPAEAYQPLVWDDDAAAALVTASVHPSLSGVYDVADDQPLTRGELATALAAAVRRPVVHRVPTALARAALGSRMDFLVRSQRVSHQLFTAATGWTPAIPDAAVGLGELQRIPIG